MPEPQSPQWLAQEQAPSHIDSIPSHNRFTTTQRNILGNIMVKATKNMGEVRKRIELCGQTFPVDPDTYSTLFSRKTASSSKYGYVEPDVLSVARQIAEMHNDALFHYNTYAKLDHVRRFNIEES